jgi:amino acid adenylation domain-containing protein
VVCSGEALSPELRRRFLERLPARLENLYGPTEASVDVTAWSCLDQARGGVVPIGRPVANTCILVLDRSLRPVAIGVPGELCIGGVQLARGYWSRPALTAERFVPDPSCAEPGGRLYRTGDLVRYLPDGAVEYLGRIDFQVKVRGFRIELGEIESVLAAHPAVRETVVVARVQEGGDSQLVGYVVPEGGTEPEVSALRSFLGERLPEHMVPAAWVMLREMPLTTSGKIDRRALPAPERMESEYVAPRTPIEQVVAGIWSELLRTRRVGREDNFFDLGGDSIKAVRLVSRINERLSSDLRVQDVFKHQSVGALAERIATRSGSSLRDDHAAGLAQIERLQQAVLADERQRRHLPSSSEDFFPLSGIENGMIYYSLLLPEQPIYHDQHAYLLSIPDLAVFYRALKLLAGRHPVLRSTFHLFDFEVPMKVVHRAVDIEPDIEDLSSLSQTRQGGRIEEYRAHDLHHKFSFNGERLWRLKLFRLTQDLYCSVWTWHHAILDGWSNLTFWLELNELCARRDLDSVDRLPPLASSYKDYLAISLGRRRSASTEAFWREILAGSHRNVLPFSRGTARERSAFGMRSLQHRIDRDLLQALRGRAAELHVSLQSVFVAAHVHLLQVTSGEEDLLTGVVSHDRPGVADGDKIVGCFLNTFPLRLAATPGESGRTLVQRVNHYLVGEKEHEIPLVDIAAIVGARDTGSNPIFDTLLNFMDFHLVEDIDENVLFQPMAASSARGSMASLSSEEMTNTLFDLEISATLSNPFVRIKFSPQHFELADIERALALYQRILTGLARDFDSPVDRQELLSSEERQQLVLSYNDTVRNYPRERPLHSFFEEQAALQPKQLAVLSSVGSLTYGEIERQANRLARWLLAQGVEPGDNVGICYERTPEISVALYAVLKVAAAYVPLEPAYPAARKGYILHQSGVSRLLADRLYQLPEDCATRLLTPLPEELAALSSEPLSLRPRPEDLAYTIYTSGSTGTPKGVMIEHHSAANLIEWVNREMEVGPDTRVLMVSSVCFDLSVYDLFGALGAGATVVLARQEEVQDPAALKRLVVEQKVTFWNSVPSTLGLLVQYLEDTEPDFRGDDLQIAFLSGDWIPLSLPERVRRFFPRLRMISLGGATEATVWSISHSIETIDPAWVSIPYGRPIDNNSFYILDRNFELVPPGVVGDLYIGGIGVARGYAGDAEKTAASFVPDLFSADPRARLYRTGDLGRMLPEEEIEFLGRSDHQVKIRGFRVELGEIESQLSRYSGLREAVVLARADRVGQKYLCAYAVPAGEAPSVTDLQAHLAETLPQYMIPETFVFLPELPLTANGKIDRRALPEPEVANLTGGAAYTAPEGEVEPVLTEIWQDVLGVSGIGVRHDFFALGGHSLSAIQVLTRIRQRFEIDLPLPDFFAEPTVAGLALAVERLLGTGEQAPPLVRRERPALIPLSFAQERLWFLDQLQPGGSVYNLPLALGLRGDLSWRALAASLDAVAARHEVLRTHFASVDGRPIQVIAPALDLAPPVVDLTALPEDIRRGEARRLSRHEAARPYDLAHGPLVRTTLLRLASDHHLALFGMHHIVSDGWSMGVLVREVGHLYTALVRGERLDLPELPVQYADFAIWQRQWLSGEVLADQIAYWRHKLAGVPPVLDLPFDRPRPPVQRFRGAQLPAFIPAETLSALAGLQRAHGTTLYMPLLAAFQTLLARLSGQEDLAVGSPVAGRNRMETEGLIGFFVNTVVLRGELGGDPSFAEALGRVRQTAVEAFAHEDLPFEKIVEELQPERSLAHSPLFQVLLVLQNAPMGALELPGLNLEPAPAETGRTKFDLTLSLNEIPQGLTGSWEYDADLFDAATVRRLHGHFVTLLAAAVSEPDRRVSELPLLSPAERTQLLREWNDTEAGPVRACLHELVAAQVTRTPEAVAAVHGDQSWTYDQLDRRANHIAQHLRCLGVGPEVTVGVCIDRSLEMLAAILGILKAGGAYVPLDQAYPDERLAFMLENSAAVAVLTQESLLDRLSRLAPHILALGHVASPLDVESESAPPAVADPGNLAYVIYTSGSTGRPKGVGIEHRSAAALVQWAQEAYSADELAGVLAATSICFDLSVFEIFAPLAAGGRVILAGNALELPRLPAAAEVTLVNTVPSAIAELARGGDIPPGVLTVNLAGEPLRGVLAREVYARSEVVRVINLYGPTEDTTYSTQAPVAREGRREPSIGRPLSGRRAYVLARDGEPAPVGVPGELHLSGAGLARGYLGRPELTAERFIPDPYGEMPGARVYRSGDLARYRPDGDLEYLGRLDHQVKVRGFRIELGEIETTLSRHPAVAQALLVALGDQENRALAAYVVPAEGSAPEASALREHLLAQLPEFMVPVHWVLLAALPLNANGKVDRKALPHPERPSAAAVYAAPQSYPEQLIAEVWQGVLGAERIGVRDNFFELGGHSLLAIQVLTRIRQHFAVDLPLPDFFAAPTVAGLAAAVERLRGSAEQAPPLVRRERPAHIPLSFAQERLWFLDQLQPGGSVYNLPLALGLRGDLSWRALAASLDAVADRHEVLRTRFASVDGRPIQVIAPALDLAPPVVDLTALPEEMRRGEARRLSRHEAARPYDLTHGPLVRATLLRLAGDHHLALFGMHHIVSDGWSMGVLVREVGQLYSALRRGERPALPPLPVQYADFAIWQRQWLSGEVLAHQLAYWRRKLAGVPPVLDLPFDRPRPPVQRFRGAQLPAFIPAGTLSALAGLQRAQGTTLYMTLLAAFQVLLARLSGQEDMAVGSPVAGRNRMETEGLIGFFVNTVVLRGELAGDPSFTEALGRVRQTAVEAFAHENLPFEKLVEELQPERSLAHSPLFQVLLVLQNAPMGTLELPGLTLEPAPAETGRTKFDLTLSLNEIPQGLTGSWEYDADLFDAATVRRLHGHFATLLTAALSQPERRVSDLPLLSPAERTQILAWNRALPSEPSTLCLHEIFSAQAARAPEAVALSWDDGEMTYGELDRLSDRAADHLVAQGVGPDVLVALALERGPLMIVAILAILKAGGAYVPVDPAYPRERQELLLTDSRASVLVSERRLAAGLPASDARLVCLDEIPALPDDTGAPRAAVPPQGLAYVIYTSGSTGQPKGVLVRHDNVVRLFTATEPWFAFGPEDAWTLFHSYAFDFSVWEIWGALLYGGRLVIVPAWTSRSPEDFHELLLRERVTVLNQTPSAFRQLIAADLARGGDLDLRLVVFGGEALDLQGLRPWFERHGDGRPLLVNMYGITETTVHVTYRPIRMADLTGSTSPIGAAIPDLGLSVLDRALQPVPVGVPGELCVGGTGLALGYLNRPDLTAERFVPDPFGTAGGRIYRSGDLARYRPDGDLEYLGRLDHQVKVRGFRIELGEIEAALSRHPEVAQALLIAVGNREGRTLAAYVVPAESSTVDVTALREHLLALLPEFMVPTLWVLLPALPLNVNGKVDRKALPHPERPTAAAVYAPPQSHVEQSIAEVWQGVLGTERIGVRDNFFELGGHSLLMARVQSRLREKLGREISMLDLLSHPTVDSLARFLTRTEEDQQGSGEQEEQTARQTERAEEGKARLLQMRRSNRPLPDGVQR